MGNIKPIPNLSKFKLMPDWFKKKCRCHFCGTDLGVKYEVKLFDPVISDEETTVTVCSKCVYNSIMKL